MEFHDIKTELIRITDPDQQQSDIARAAACIRQGGLVVFPTETVYGLGGDATNSSSAKKIYAAKGRPSDNPLIIHVACPEDAAHYAQLCPTYERLARAFMPGPLTVILPRKQTIPKDTTGGLETVAVRCPVHPVARALIRAAGVPIAAPSANISGKPSPTCARHVAEDMNGRVDFILDGGDCEIGLESTIVAVTGEDRVTLLRPGAITYDALCMVVTHVEIARAVSEKLGDNEKPLSPGMKYRHYAPDAPVVLLDGSDIAALSFLLREQHTHRCAILCYDEEYARLIENVDDHSLLFPIGKATDVASHAKTLFTALREADRAKPDIIYAHLPSKEGLGLALYNRMIRASAHTVLNVD